MTQEEKDSLLNLLLKLDEDGLLNIYDEEESHHDVEWIFFDRDELCIKMKK